MADIRNFNGNESKTKQKNPLRKQSNLRLLKNEDTADYKEKIKKLLSLSKSPNEHEAQSALAKAQQLMAIKDIRTIR